MGTLAAMLKLERRQQEVAGAEDLADNNRQRNNGSGSSVFCSGAVSCGLASKRRTVDDDAAAEADQKQQQ